MNCLSTDQLQTGKLTLSFYRSCLKVVRQFMLYSLSNQTASRKKSACFSIGTRLVLIVVRSHKKGVYLRRERHAKKHWQWNIICSKNAILPEDKICSHNWFSVILFKQSTHPRPIHTSTHTTFHVHIKRSWHRKFRIKHATWGTQH